MVKRSASLRILAFILVLFVIGCGQPPAEEAVTNQPTSGVEVPAGVTAVRNSTVTFLRDSAAICVPPEGAAWHTEQIENEATVGAGVYRFTSEACTLTISYPQSPPADTVYHAAYHNADTDFCWQAFVAADGEILTTGYEAITEDIVNPSANYCEQQGYEFAIVTKEDGTPCTACIFPDGSTCNSWEYFYGNCAPGDNPAP